MEFEKQRNNISRGSNTPKDVSFRKPDFKLKIEIVSLYDLAANDFKSLE
jgi:hypothetical protein